MKLRWCRARDYDGSQIPVTTAGFELRAFYMQLGWLEVEVYQLKSATSAVKLRIRVLRIRLTY